MSDPAGVPLPISIIATVMNERDSVQALLDSLQGQTRLAAEIVIVDGGFANST